MFDPINKIVSFFGTPMCADRQTYAEWHDYARRSPPGEAGFCTDCTPEYQARMIAEGRCENPWIEFEMHEGETPPPSALTDTEKLLFKLSDKGIVGYIPQSVKRLNRSRTEKDKHD